MARTFAGTRIPRLRALDDTKCVGHLILVPRYMSNPTRVIAPSLACATSAAYLAMTPCV